MIEKRKRDKRMFVLFGINLTTAAVGSSLGTLLPVYAIRLGADANQAGLIMSLAFLSMAGGALAAGRVADRQVYRKPVLVAAGFLLVVVLLLATRIQTLGQLALFSVALTFLDGVQMATVSTLAGLHAGKTSRGRTFGLLGSAGALGALVSGLAGALVLRWGFSGLFTAAAALALLKPLLALRFQDAAVSTAQREPVVSGRAVLTRPFVIMFLASVAAFATGGMYSLSRSLGMTQSGFDAAALSSTVAVGGLITLPFPMVLGLLSDRIGRRPLLALCYTAGAASLLLLMVSTQLWHFWAASAFHAVLNASLGIGSATVTDLVPRPSLGSALALFGTTNWIGMILGNALTGNAIRSFGLAPTLLAGAGLGLLAVLLAAPFSKQGMNSAASTENYA